MASQESVGKSTFLTALKGAATTVGSSVASALMNPGASDVPVEWIVDPGYPLPKMGVRKLKQVRQLQEAYQWAAHRKINRAKADNPEAVYALLSPIMAGVQVEQLYILAMDSHAQCITAPTVVSRGDVCGTDAGPRIVFRAALLQGAVQVIIAHNHPSGSITPSAADKNMTTNLVRCGRILDVPLVDHVLIAPGTGFTSLRRDFAHLWQ